MNKINGATRPAAHLRRLLQEPGFIVMPGSHDALSSKMIHEAGFKVSFMNLVGFPDYYELEQRDLSED